MACLSPENFGFLGAQYITISHFPNSLMLIKHSDFLYGRKKSFLDYCIHSCNFFVSFFVGAWVLHFINITKALCPFILRCTIRRIYFLN